MKKWLLGLPLVLISVFIWLPLWMLISGTFMGGAELSENLAPVLEGRGGTAVWPVMARYPTLAAYVELLLDTPQFFTVFWNSCRQVFPIILGHVLLGAPAAWAFAKFHFRGKKILYTLYIVLMLMPFQVTMVSSYLVLNKLGLIDTVWAVILPGAASTLPVFIMTRFFMDIPEAVMEAAAVDGASSFQTFLRFGLPLGAPGILSAVVLGFLESVSYTHLDVYKRQESGWSTPFRWKKKSRRDIGMDWNMLYTNGDAPSLMQIAEYIDNPLWAEFDSRIRSAYRIEPYMDYSRCSMQPGWNIKYKKSGKSLCTCYPMQGYFIALVVIGSRELTEAELLMPLFSDYVQKVFRDAKTGNGQKWLMLEMCIRDSHQTVTAGATCQPNNQTSAAIF